MGLLLQVWTRSLLFHFVYYLYKGSNLKILDYEHINNGAHSMSTILAIIQMIFLPPKYLLYLIHFFSINNSKIYFYRALKILNLLYLLKWVNILKKRSSPAWIIIKIVIGSNDLKRRLKKAVRKSNSSLVTIRFMFMNFVLVYKLYIWFIFFILEFI